MLHQIGRRPQNTYIGRETPGITQSPYIPPSLTYKITPSSVINYKEVQKKVFKNRELVGQPKRSNLFNASNNMHQHLVYGSNTIVAAEKAYEKIKKKESIEKSNDRFTPKYGFAKHVMVDELGQDILDDAGNKILMEGTAPNYGQPVVYPDATITTAEIIEKNNKLKSKTSQILKNLSKDYRKYKDDKFIKAYKQANPVFERMTDQRPPDRVKVTQMSDQEPEGIKNVTEMSEHVPHKEGSKTSGLSEAELKDTEAALKALSGGESKVEEGTRLTIKNVNDFFDRVVERTENSKKSYDDKLSDFNTIKKTLKRKKDKLESDYEGVSSKDIPNEIHKEHGKTEKNINIIEELIYRLKISHIDELQKSSPKTPSPKTFKTPKKPT